MIIGTIKIFKFSNVELMDTVIQVIEESSELEQKPELIEI